MGNTAARATDESLSGKDQLHRMERERVLLSYAVSFIAIALAAGHVIWPSVNIDAITIGLLVVAALPWLGPIIKSIELPSGLKVEYRERLAQVENRVAHEEERVDELADRVTNVEWQVAHSAICRRIAAVMVDIVRLLMVRSSPLAYQTNNARHDEFMGIAEDHFEDLTNNIAALPTIGDPRQYEKSRELELPIRWLLRTMAVRVDSARISESEIGVVQDALRLAIGYFRLYPSAEGDSFDATVRAVLDKNLTRQPIERDADETFGLRQSMQTEILSMHERDVGPGIRMDVDNQLAVRYFAIDCWLLDVRLTSDGSM